MRFLQKTLLPLLAGVGTVFVATALCACSGSAGGAIAPTPQSPAQASVPGATSIPFSDIGSAILLPSVGGYSESITLPANDAPANTNLSLNISTKPAAGAPAIPSDFYLTQPFLYFTLSSSKTVTMQGFPAFTLTLPKGLHWDGGPLHLAYYDPATGWRHIGESTITGSTLTFAGNHTPITLKAGVKYVALPFACAVTKIFVTNNDISVYDDQGNQITPAGGFPHTLGPIGITFDSCNRYLYIVNFPDAIFVYNEEGYEIPTTGGFPNLNVPGAIAFDSHNRYLYVTEEFVEKDTVGVYDEAGNEITTTGTFPNVIDASGIAFDSNNHHLYVTNTLPNTVTVYDEAGNLLNTFGSYPSLNTPAGIAFDSNNHHLYVTNAGYSTMTVYDEAGNQITTTGSFPNLSNPGGIAFDPDNHYLYVVNERTNAMTVYDEEGNEITTTGSFPGLSEPLSVAVAPR